MIKDPQPHGYNITGRILKPLKLSIFGNMGLTEKKVETTLMLHSLL